MSSPDTIFAPPTTRTLRDGSEAVALFDLGLEGADCSAGEQQVGPYRLLSQLGEGGLGVVWKAEQYGDVRRVVALKLIRPGLQLRRDVIARFQLERQSLARMKHPHIATLHDAGTTEDGRPWFAMELVEGQPLTTHCNQLNVSLRQRLELFIKVCDAVQHAHEKGVLHRDLKPSNLLVTEVNGQSEPKVIDFGIARWLDPAEQEDVATLMQTRVGEMPSATYPYMSPEQAARDTTAVDTRSDIYTLGVILYELVTGQLPMPAEVIRSLDFLRMAQWLREEEPSRPSSCASADRRALRGELDWIILKAMAKEPSRRYSSAAALSEDLQRHLTDRPVEARPAGSGYLLRKWMQRHRVAVVTSSLILSTLLAALFVSLTALSNEKRARMAEQDQRLTAERHADAAARASVTATAAREQAEAAKLTAENAQQVASIARERAEELMNEMLFDLRDRASAIGRLDLLDQVSQNAESYFAKLPTGNESIAQARHRAAMHQNRGVVLAAQGQWDAGLEHHRKAAAISETLAAREPDDARRQMDVAVAMQHLGDLLLVKREPDLAKAAYQRMLAVLKPFADLPDSQVILATAHERLGDMALRDADLATAKQHFTSGHEHVTSQHGRHAALLEQRLGDVTLAESRYDEAQRWFRQSHERLLLLLKAAGEDTTLMADEAMAAGKRASVSEASTAATWLQHQLDTFQELTKRDAMNLEWRSGLSTAHFQLGVFRAEAGQHAEAESHYRAALQVLDTVTNAAHLADKLARQRAAAQLRLAACLLQLDKGPESRRAAREALALIQKLPRDANTAQWQRTAEALAEEP
jgi:serine/threonine protein kinase/tetratricopeptide (TPR) repeat protein